MKAQKKYLISKYYSVRSRLFTFVITAILLVIFISLTAIIGLNSTYNSLSDLRDRSLNQMFFTMTLGIKTAQISTYSTRLTQIINALEYKEESRLLTEHVNQLHTLLSQAKQTEMGKDEQFRNIMLTIDSLEESIQALLQQSHKRHISHTDILSGLNQSLLYIRHVKRLGQKSNISRAFILQLEKIEKLIEQSTLASFSPEMFVSIQSVFSFLPAVSQQPDIYAEFLKLENKFTEIIHEARKLVEVNLRIKFLTYKVDALVKKIDGEYTALAKNKVENVNIVSNEIQQYLSHKTTSISVFTCAVIILIIILGTYIYTLIGKRLYSITSALKKFSEGDKTVQIPQQSSKDEIGDLARAFHSFQHDLAHSQKMQTMGQLAGGIAHDFNNLLAVIIGNLDLIDPASLQERQQLRLNRALKAAETSATLTQRLLAYARKQPLRPTGIDLNQFILEFKDFIKHSIPSTIKVRLDLSENLPPAYMDRNQLETALVNLIVNAKDAMNDVGQIIIQSKRLLVQRTHRQEDMLQLSIIDEGCGMAQEIQKHVFEPFFTTKENGRGNGLGLSMVYGFIRQSKGRVLIESILGKGTTIHLQLPILRESGQTNETTLITSAQAVHKPCSLLLVEDQATLRETLVEQLSSVGYNVIDVNSGERAIAFLEKSGRHIDYLLSDIVLSNKMSGLDVAHFAKQHFPNIKILLMTGNHTNNLASQPYPVLNKPFKLEVLAQTLGSIK
ncbi:hybrid sensor histidine kinase/response regulator [Conservatibacter flavescens]|uniref:histidine kinase n=1 Tax=Conservatibacter flavescens TaxID=28161 RepID=A0A2M8S134_9PAST|nr:hybrid sensor histidine kinase/response regulator [Conservatibacter flavescens]PJG84850.1 hypothetical protein CVP05_08405 [Conservatibacter flavescens]